MEIEGWSGRWIVIQRESEEAGSERRIVIQREQRRQGEQMRQGLGPVGAFAGGGGMCYTGGRSIVLEVGGDEWRGTDGPRWRFCARLSF
jgi:hypothetical protein